MAEEPIPIILCGKTEAIGEGVIEGLKPDYEVVHFVLTPEAGAAELPLVLQGRAPEGRSSGIGSGDVSRGAWAVVLGAGYDDEGIEAMRGAVAGAADARRVPWLRPDTTRAAPPLGPEYGKAMVARVREAIRALEAEGKLDGQDDGVVWY